MKDDKLKYMNELYENGIANEIRKYNVEKKMTPKEMFNERKKVCLIDNGVELEEELNNIEEEGKMSEEIKEEEISKNNADENINNRKHKSYSNKLYKSQIEFNHNIISLQHFNNQSMTTKNKKVYTLRQSHILMMTSMEIFSFFPIWARVFGLVLTASMSSVLFMPLSISNFHNLL